MFLRKRNLVWISSAIQRAWRFAVAHKVSLSVSVMALALAASIMPLIGQGPVRERAESEKDSAKLIRERAQWFFHQRAYPLNHIPAGARIRAVEHLARMSATNGTFMQRLMAKSSIPYSAALLKAGSQEITLSSANWTPIGPAPTTSFFFNLTSGRVNALAVDPCDSTGNTIYAGGAQGGLWKTTNGGTTWTPMTDNQLSVSSGSIAVDPVPGDCTGGHTGSIYYGTGEENFAFDSFYGAGVLISHDGGNTWTKDNTFVNVTSGTPPVITPTNAVAAGPYIGALAIQPGTSGGTQVLLAGIQGVSSPNNSGIYRSTDAGMDWTRVLPPNANPPLAAPNDFGTGVAFDPADLSGKTAYAALGVPFCTGQGGACNESGDEELDNGVYKSIDGGQTWTRLTALDNAAQSLGGSANYGRITIAVGPPASSGKPGELIVSIANIQGSSSDLLGIFESTDGGNTFSPLSNAPAFCDHQCFYDMSIGISPTNPSLIFLGGGPAASGKGISDACGSIPANSGISAAIRSTDGGNSWADVSCDNTSASYIHVDTHAFAFSPNGQLYIGNDGGIWASADVLTGSAGAQHWSDLNTTLNLTQFYPGNSIHPSNPEVAIAGGQDNGTQLFNGALNWTDTDACGDGGWTAIDPSVPSTVYAACAATGTLGEVNKNQVDGVGGTNGENWIVLDTPTMDSDNQRFIPPLTLDPTTPQNLYFGTYRVWQSTNGGISWNTISPDLTGSTTTKGCGGGACVITALAVAPSSSGTLYAGTDLGQIWISTNANAASPSFSEIDQSNTPSRVITQIAVSPTNPQIAFAAYSGFSGFTDPNTGKPDNAGHLFETTNGGTSWTDISCHVSDCGTPGATDLPNTPVNDVVVDPDDLNHGTLYVATDVGVFATSNDGASWSELADGLPHVECTSLKLDNTARVLQVGTHGRGDWDLQLPFPASITKALTAISPVSTSAGASSFPMTLSGFGFPASPTVNFGSTQLTPSSATSTQITVTIPASALASSAEIAVSVSSVPNSLNFSLEGPAPTLNAVSPNPITAGSSVTLTVTGSNFTGNSEVVWTPTSGANANLSVPLAQLSGGTSTSFSVTVPASLLSSTVGGSVVPVGTARPQGPAAPWLLAALCAGLIGVALLLILPRRRQAVLGWTFGMVLLLTAAGCSSASNPGQPPVIPPPTGGTSASVNISVYSPGPGGGASLPQKITVNP